MRKTLVFLMLCVLMVALCSTGMSAATTYQNTIPITVTGESPPRLVGSSSVFSHWQFNSEPSSMTWMDLSQNRREDQFVSITLMKSSVHYRNYLEESTMPATRVYWSGSISESPPMISFGGYLLNQTDQAVRSTNAGRASPFSLESGYAPAGTVFSMLPRESLAMIFQVPIIAQPEPIDPCKIIGFGSNGARESESRWNMLSLAIGDGTNEVGYST